MIRIIFFDGLDELYHHAKFAGCRCAPAVGAKTWCLYVSLRAGCREAVPAGIVFTQWPEIYISPPSGKNYELDRKMDNDFYDGHEELYHHAKFGRDRTTRAYCRCENV